MFRFLSATPARPPGVPARPRRRRPRPVVGEHSVRWRTDGHRALHLPELLLVPAGRSPARRARRARGPQSLSSSTSTTGTTSCTGSAGKWKDIFSDPAYTARQRTYAGTIRNGGVYTPQVVVDGVVQTVGSRRGRVLRLLERSARAEKPVRVTVAPRAGRRIHSEPGIEGGPALCDGAARPLRPPARHRDRGRREQGQDARQPSRRARISGAGPLEGQAPGDCACRRSPRAQPGLCGHRAGARPGRDPRRRPPAPS